MKNIKRVKVANIYFKRSIYDKEDPILIWSRDKVKMIKSLLNIRQGRVWINKWKGSIRF